MRWRLRKPERKRLPSPKAEGRNPKEGRIPKPEAASLWERHPLRAHLEIVTDLCCSGGHPACRRAGHLARRKSRPAGTRRSSGRQDAALYGRQDACRYMVAVSRRAHPPLADARMTSDFGLRISFGFRPSGFGFHSVGGRGAPPLIRTIPLPRRTCLLRVQQ